MLLGCLLPLCVNVAVAATEDADDTLSAERRQYEAAMRAVDKGRWTEYEQLRPALDQYPLAIYLDYFQLTRQPATCGRRMRCALSAARPIRRCPIASPTSTCGRREEQRWQVFSRSGPTSPRVSNSVLLFSGQAGSGRQRHRLGWRPAPVGCRRVAPQRLRSVVRRLAQVRPAHGRGRLVASTQGL